MGGYSVRMDKERDTTGGGGSQMWSLGGGTCRGFGL